MAERTFSFTVSLPHDVYIALLVESRKREKLSAAVPSRTARQLVTERLEELKPVKPQAAATEKTTEPKKTRSTRKRGIGEENRETPPMAEGIE